MSASWQTQALIDFVTVAAVTDVVDAMASHRRYRPALGLDAALEEIKQNRGALYEARVVDVCLSLAAREGFQLEER